MSKKEAALRAEKLRTAINRHRYLYHVLDQQEISDAALDSLKHELKEIEDEFPDLITPDSPTQRVGGSPLDKFQKVRHDVPMLSLEDVFSEEEFAEWHKRISKLLGGSLPWLFGEIKFDGLAVSLVYRNGVFVEGSTRGDGRTGENVTQNLKTIESIPLTIELHRVLKKFPHLGQRIKETTVEIRGEIMITKKNFERINKEQKKLGERPYANPRNLAAGSIRQLDPGMAASRQLEFFGYHVVTNLGQEFHDEEHEILESLGFRSDKHARVLKDVQEVFAFRKEIERERDHLPYHIDGLVVTVNENRLFQKLGVVGKAPRGAVAFKFAPEEATTVVNDIMVQVGRTGVLTPVAHLEPVLIGGVTVSRATLHNYDEIRRLGLKIGDTVVVGRAGDVIPDVRVVLADLRTGKEKTFHMPKKCPICGSVVAKREGEVAYRCTNPKCPALKRESLYHFVSKKAFDVDGLGPKIVDVLLDQNLIQDAADLFDLKEGDLALLDHFGEKSASNLVRSIQARKKVTLQRFIFGLGILHIGEETSILLAKEITSRVGTKRQYAKIAEIAKAFRSFTEDELQSLPDIGPKVAASIHQWFSEAHNLAFLEKLGRAGIEAELFFVPSGEGELSGKIFVFTGEMESMSRDEAKDLVRKFGGDVSESVSKKADYLVVGKSPGSKYDRAQELGIAILTESEFMQLIRKLQNR